MPLTPTRREVLKVGMAGTAGTMAGILPASLIDALAAPPACGTIGDVEHVVILIQENRSFDHYFGRYKGVRGFDDRGPGALQIFNQGFTQAQAAGWPDPLLPFHLNTQPAPLPATPRQGMCSADIDHQWKTQHYVYNGGAMDRWVAGHVDPTIVPSGYSAGDGTLTMAYFDRSDLEFYYALADNFTICDGYFCSVIGGTDINRLYTMTGTMDPDAWDGGVQFLDTQVANRQNYYGALGASGGWKTYPELLQAAGVSWKVYSDPATNAEENPLAYFKSHGFPSGAGQPLYDNAFLPTFANFLADCQQGTLPQVSWVFANFVTDAEHPPAPLEWGEDVVRMAVGALTASPQWSKSAMLITYDENGGFFDHVPPPAPPPKTPGEFIPRPPASGLPAYTESDKGKILDPIGLGFRVPLLVVSPFSRNPTPAGSPLVCSDTFDHTSTLRFLETVFKVPVPNRGPATGIPTQGTPGLSQWRRQTVGDLTSAFNFASGPRTFDAAGLPATNRADPRVLGECITTDGAGHFITPQAPTVAVTPPTAPQAMPAQEMAFGTVQRPSGPVGQAVCPATTTAATPAGPGSPTTSAGGRADSAGVAMVAGAAVLAAGWWAGRVRANNDAVPAGDHVVGPPD